MGDTSRDTSYNGFTLLNKKKWISEAKKTPGHFSAIKILLDRGLGYSLNAAQLHTEGSALLLFILQETGGFSGMSEPEIRKSMVHFLNAYIDFRDEERYPGIDDVESEDGSFENCFIVIARRAKNFVNKKTLPTSPIFIPAKSIKP